MKFRTPAAEGGSNSSASKNVKHLDIIIRNAKRLLRLEQNLLDMTKIEDKALKLDKEKFDLIENIQSVRKRGKFIGCDRK